MNERKAIPQPIAGIISEADEAQRVLRITGKPMEYWTQRYGERLVNHLMQKRISLYRWYLASEIGKFATLYGIEHDDVVYALVPIEVIQMGYPNFKQPAGIDPLGHTVAIKTVLGFRLNPSRFAELNIAA